jgi:HEPN domain
MAARPRGCRRHAHAARVGARAAQPGACRRTSAKAIADADPVGAYQLLYDAARKALSAVLENQGLRATSSGGHIAVLDAVAAQLEPPLGRVLRPFDRMRRRRNEAEYPRQDAPGFTSEDVARELPKVEQILNAAGRVLDQMSPY